MMRSVITRVEFTREKPWFAIQKEYYFDFPSHGGLVISPGDLRTFMGAVTVEDPRLLDAEGWKLRFTPQAAAHGAYTLGWHVEESDRGPIFAHNGGAMGTSAMVRYYPNEGVATCSRTNLVDSRRLSKKDMDALDDLLFNVVQ